MTTHLTPALGAAVGAVAALLWGLLSAPAHAATCAEGGPCRVGDTGPGGGTVFYVADTPRPWGRALEVAPAGWAGTVRDPKAWWCLAEEPEGADPDRPGSLTARVARFTAPAGIGRGRTNTRATVALCGEGSAAGLAAAYTGGGLSDWHLPAGAELAALYRARASVPGGLTGLYWSSSKRAQRPGTREAFYGTATWQDFDWGDQGTTALEGMEVTGVRVRPIRRIPAA
ncbi:MAG: hypothetical protein KGP10_10260 [Actinomycetales bacterium]|nr:hypothetical protein [Actinomycetales bacterium]